MEKVLTYAIHISHDVKESHGRSNHFWMIPALFNTLCFTDEPRYLECDGTIRIVRDWNRRQEDFKLLHNLFLESFSDLKRRDILYVRPYLISCKEIKYM